MVVVGGMQGIEGQFGEDVADEVVEFRHVAAEEFREGEGEGEGGDGASDGTAVFEEEAVDRVGTWWTVSAPHAGQCLGGYNDI